MIRLFRGARTGPMIVAVHADAQHDPELAAEVMAPARRYGHRRGRNSRDPRLWPRPT